MKLYVDLSQPVVVESERLAWIDSPANGVQRRMLERDGDEVARATTIVRFAPSSYFPEHTHIFGTEKVELQRWQPGTQLEIQSSRGGLEIFVLEGRLEDSLGHYPTYTWIRDGASDQRSFLTRKGCVFYLKTGHLKPTSNSVQA